MDFRKRLNIGVLGGLELFVEANFMSYHRCFCLKSINLLIISLTFSYMVFTIGAS